MKINTGLGLIFLAGAAGAIGYLIYGEIKKANMTALQAVQGTSNINILAGQASKLLAQIGLTGAA